VVAFVLFESAGGGGGGGDGDGGGVIVVFDAFVVSAVAAVVDEVVVEFGGGGGGGGGGGNGGGGGKSGNGGGGLRTMPMPSGAAQYACATIAHNAEESSCTHASHGHWTVARVAFGQENGHCVSFRRLAPGAPG
jgi:hypothetical protein